mgnify:CR=1 FL=1
MLQKWRLGEDRKNIFEAAMDSYNKALQLEQDALNSDGTAMKINEKRADSINVRWRNCLLR